MNEEKTLAELRELTYLEVLELFDGDQVAAGQWLSSSIRALGNHPPISLMGTKPGLQKIRNLVRKWGEGAVS
ncbi:hypothetical protein ABA45_05765 [Marinobacter psychrophilus]|uniref:Antitoxin Xre/MbcA/ParS-like toxin-binding domain-containing protein n=1 Tax=Marinobacter psychrophilus TaxID=330734 RepID=A0A0H4IAB6_9GAMM|nr:MbcA/ParS/Xre antitoxin family protein [Marinobacter psychrophilus]AKO51992.1 hypothetical protein ABA45_05765 [Marinobacter psychrophilus]